ncbi:hypothetical protein HDU67_001040 [Dinochytrium kinnereticum]|nr:hypothetical protein HDU67_001040 [Dinochytrium kinnereticum]
MTGSSLSPPLSSSVADFTVIASQQPPLSPTHRHSLQPPTWDVRLLRKTSAELLSQPDPLSRITREKVVVKASSSPCLKTERLVNLGGHKEEALRKTSPLFVGQSGIAYDPVSLEPVESFEGVREMHDLELVEPYVDIMRKVYSGKLLEGVDEESKLSDVSSMNPSISMENIPSTPPLSVKISKPLPDIPPSSPPTLAEPKPLKSSLAQPTKLSITTISRATTLETPINPFLDSPSSARKVQRKVLFNVDDFRDHGGVRELVSSPTSSSGSDLETSYWEEEKDEERLSVPQVIISPLTPSTIIAAQPSLILSYIYTPEFWTFSKHDGNLVFGVVNPVFKHVFRPIIGKVRVRWVRQQKCSQAVLRLAGSTDSVEVTTGRLRPGAPATTTTPTKLNRLGSFVTGLRIASHALHNSSSSSPALRERFRHSWSLHHPHPDQGVLPVEVSNVVAGCRRSSSSSKRRGCSEDMTEFRNQKGERRGSVASAISLQWVPMVDFPNTEARQSGAVGSESGSPGRVLCVVNVWAGDDIEEEVTVRRVDSGTGPSIRRKASAFSLDEGQMERKSSGSSMETRERRRSSVKKVVSQANLSRKRLFSTPPAPWASGPLKYYDPLKNLTPIAIPLDRRATKARKHKKISSPEASSNLIPPPIAFSHSLPHKKLHKSSSQISIQDLLHATGLDDKRRHAMPHAATLPPSMRGDEIAPFEVAVRKPVKGRMDGKKSSDVRERGKSFTILRGRSDDTTNQDAASRSAQLWKLVSPRPTPQATSAPTSPPQPTPTVPPSLSASHRPSTSSSTPSHRGFLSLKTRGSKKQPEERELRRRATMANLDGKKSMDSALHVVLTGADEGMNVKAGEGREVRRWEKVVRKVKSHLGFG